jgi:secreted trypsin-like serine protease
MSFKTFTTSAILAAGTCCFQHAANAQTRDSAKPPSAPVNSKLPSSLVNTLSRLSPYTYIQGGQNAVFKDYPFQVALIWSSSRVGHEFDGLHCGGTLIDKVWVLTAAHCVTYAARNNEGNKGVQGDQAGQVDQGDQGNQGNVGIVRGPVRAYLPSDGGVAQSQDLDVYIGSDNFKGGDRIAVMDVHRHPDYSGMLSGNDIALLKLEREPREGVSYGIVKLVDDKAMTKVDTDVIAIGWGVGKDNLLQSNLQQVSLKILDKKVCNENAVPAIIGSMPEPWALTLRILVRTLKPIADASILDDTTICAGDPAPASSNSYKDSCPGDSGGPLLVKDKDGKPVQIGITSWGPLCSIPREKLYGAVYTRVGDFLKWIDTQTRGSAPASDGEPPSGLPAAPDPRN